MSSIQRLISVWTIMWWRVVNNFYLSSVQVHSRLSSSKQINKMLLRFRLFNRIGLRISVVLRGRPEVMFNDALDDLNWNFSNWFAIKILIGKKIKKYSPKNNNLWQHLKISKHPSLQKRNFLPMLHNFLHTHTHYNEPFYSIQNKSKFRKFGNAFREHRRRRFDRPWPKTTFMESESAFDWVCVSSMVIATWNWPNPSLDKDKKQPLPLPVPARNDSRT